MPRPVTVRKIVRPWGIRFRVYIPRRVAGGQAKVRDFETKAAAEQFARQVNTSATAHDSGFEAYSLQDRALIAYQVRALPRGVLDLPKAIELFHRYATNNVRLLKDVVQECLDDKRQRGLSGSYRRVLGDDLRRFSEVYGEREAHTVTSRELSEWIHSRSELGPYSRRNLRINLGTLFRFAVAHKYATDNPMGAVPEIKISLGPRCILTAEEAERLMISASKVDAPLIPLIAMVLFGGLRPEEARRCRWDFVKRDVIDLPAGSTKNNKRRLIELRDAATLKAWLARGGDMPPKRYRERLGIIRAVSGVPWGNDILRHSFVSYGVPIWGVSQTALKADHSEGVLKQHYRELVTRASAVQFWNILPR